jgi:hypothetical protein
MGAGVQAILSNSKSASSHKLSSPKSPADAPGASANNTSQAKAFAFSREDSYYAREQEPEILEREKKIREEKSRTFGKQARGPPCTLPKLASRAERAGAARSGWELLVRAPGTAPTASGQRRGLAHNVHRPIPELSADNGGVVPTRAQVQVAESLDYIQTDNLTTRALDGEGERYRGNVSRWLLTVRPPRPGRMPLRAAAARGPASRERGTQVFIGLSVGAVAFGLEEGIREITKVRLDWMQGLMGSHGVWVALCANVASAVVLVAISCILTLKVAPAAAGSPPLSRNRGARACAARAA